MRLTVDLVRWADVYINAIRQYEVNLRSYQIPIIENLAVLEDQYDSIDLSDNSIEIMENFTPMVRLRSLLFHNNKIRKIVKGLGKYLPNLENLMLSNNHIQTLADLEGIIEFKNLIRVNLLGNPVLKERNYRLWMIAHLPQLRMLDFQKVKTSERTEAYALYPKEKEKLKRKAKRKNKRQEQNQNQNKNKNNKNTSAKQSKRKERGRGQEEEGELRESKAMSTDSDVPNVDNTNINRNRNRDRDGDISMNMNANTNMQGEEKMDSINENRPGVSDGNINEVFTEQQRRALAQAIANARSPEETERLQRLIESGKFPKEGLEAYLNRQQ